MPSLKINRLALALTALNIVAMLAFWSQIQVTSAQVVPDVLRAKGLEIVDLRGIVRAQIIVQPGGNTARCVSSIWMARNASSSRSDASRPRESFPARWKLEFPFLISGTAEWRDRRQ